MVSHERILWSHTRGYYGLIREDTMVSYERILWSHMRGYYPLYIDPLGMYSKIPLETQKRLLREVASHLPEGALKE
ncbi:hypothetical protein CS543_07595 [Porphyromonas gingivalis]|nr:hypothetical protein CS543_07595 [Porphyromonas gingivalis]